MNFITSGFHFASSWLFALMGYHADNSEIALLKNDLYFIHQQIYDNHPGVYNTLDPLFCTHLEQNYQKCLHDLSQTSDIHEGENIIKTFAQSFQDGHLWVSWYADQQKKPEDKAFVVDAIAIENIGNEIYWVSLPTFAFNDVQEMQFAQVIAKLALNKNACAIVFDLSKNRGGNSAYSTTILTTLFGQDYVKSYLDKVNACVAVDWRASKDNVAYIQSVSAKYSCMRNIASFVQKSYEKGLPYYHEKSEVDLDQDSPLQACKHDVTAKIFVISDGCNASAALDFIDELKAMAYSVTLIGKTTKSDRLYMEVRTVDLPSGLGTFSFPIKVYRNRVRDDNEPYHPDIVSDIIDRNRVQELVISQCTNEHYH